MFLWWAFSFRDRFYRELFPKTVNVVYFRSFFVTALSFLVALIF